MRVQCKKINIYDILLHAIHKAFGEEKHFKTICRPSQSVNVLKRWKNLWMQKRSLCRVPFDDDGGEKFSKNVITFQLFEQYNTQYGAKQSTHGKSRKIFQQIHIFSLLLKYSCRKSATLNSWICEHLSERKRMRNIVWWCGIDCTSNFCSVFDLKM